MKNIGLIAALGIGAVAIYMFVKRDKPVQLDYEAPEDGSGPIPDYIMTEYMACAATMGDDPSCYTSKWLAPRFTPPTASIDDGGACPMMVGMDHYNPVTKQCGPASIVGTKIEAKDLWRV